MLSEGYLFAPAHNTPTERDVFSRNRQTLKSLDGWGQKDLNTIIVWDAPQLSPLPIPLSTQNVKKHIKIGDSITKEKMIEKLDVEPPKNEPIEPPKLIEPIVVVEPTVKTTYNSVNNIRFRQR